MDFTNTVASGAGRQVSAVFSAVLRCYVEQGWQKRPKLNSEIKPKLYWIIRSLSFNAKSISRALGFRRNRPLFFLEILSLDNLRSWRAALSSTTQRLALAHVLKAVREFPLYVRSFANRLRAATAGADSYCSNDSWRNDCP